MRYAAITLAAGLIFGASAPAAAQEGSVILSQYYECDIGREGILDRTVLRDIAPIFDRHVESGALTNWGFTAHAIGGTWRRLSFMVATDRTAVLQARASILRAVNAEAPDAGAVVNDVCPRHEDYLWGIQQASQVAQPNDDPPSLLSTYYTCAIAEEAEVDAIVRELYAPVLEDLVREGRLRSWSWLAHRTGGPFRRSAVFQGESQIELLDARRELQARTRGEAGGTRFSEICPSHVEYHWNPVTGG